MATWKGLVGTALESCELREKEEGEALPIVVKLTRHAVRAGPYARSRGIDKRPESLGELPLFGRWRRRLP